VIGRDQGFLAIDKNRNEKKSAIYASAERILSNFDLACIRIVMDSMPGRQADNSSE
jgi:hypothetical protein